MSANQFGIKLESIFCKAEKVKVKVGVCSVLADADVDLLSP